MLSLSIKFALILLFLFSLLITGCYQKGIFVVLKNRSGTDIVNLEISYTGGKLRKRLITNGQNFTGRIDPISESDLLISFSDKKGKLIKEKVDVYIERNYKGKIIITITPGYKLLVKDDLYIL